MTCPWGPWLLISRFVCFLFSALCTAWYMATSRVEFLHGPTI